MDDGVFIGWVQKEFTLVLCTFVLFDIELDPNLKLDFLPLVEQSEVVLTLLDLEKFWELPAVLSPVIWDLNFWGQQSYHFIMWFW